MATFRLYKSPWEEEFFKIEDVVFFLILKIKNGIFLLLLNNSL